MKKKTQIILYNLLATVLLSQQAFASSNAVGNNNQLKFIPATQKLRTKIESVFANNPKLAGVYHKIQSSELEQVRGLSEYNELLKSRELKLLNNSAEMQEALKEAINRANTPLESINTQLVDIKEQNNKLAQDLNKEYLLRDTKLSDKEIKEKINLNNIASNQLREQVASAVQSFNNIQQLYFTDTKELNNLSDLTPIQKPDILTTDALLVSVANIDQLIDSRMDNILFETLGISSGEQTTDTHGIWIKGLKSYAKQSSYKLTPGYKLNQNGVAVGIDFIDNNTIWGISYLFTVDHLNSNVLNAKEKINSHIANIYGLYKYDNDLFIDLHAKYGKSYIKKSRNNLNLSNDISDGKTTGNIYGGKVELGYSYVLQDVMYIIPSVGISYDKLQINGYKETGKGFNRKISTRTVDKTAAIAGLKLSRHIKTNSYNLIPEIHAKTFHIVNSNNDKTVITIVDGLDPLVTPSGKLAKTIYRIGGSAKISKSSALELTLGYDLGISKKFYSNTGYISAKVIF